MAVWRVTTSGAFYGQLWQNRLYVKHADNKLESEVADYVIDAWVQNVRQVQIASISWNAVEVQKVSVPPSSGFVKPIALFGAQAPSDQVLSFSAWVLRFTTGLAGRKFQGRAYIPVPMAGHYTQGVINGNGIAFWAPILNALNLNFCGNTASGYNLVIHGETGEPHDTEVTNIAVRPVIGCIRRRNIGVGV